MNHLNKTKPYLYSSNPTNLVLFFVLPFFFLQPFSKEIFAGYLNQIEFWASECFDTRNIETCKTALRISEDFQVLASSKDDHRCQTSLIALEANLIMFNFKELKMSSKHLEALKNVKKTCRNLLRN